MKAATHRAVEYLTKHQCVDADTVALLLGLDAEAAEATLKNPLLLAERPDWLFRMKAMYPRLNTNWILAGQGEVEEALPDQEKTLPYVSRLQNLRLSLAPTPLWKDRGTMALLVMVALLITGFTLYRMMPKESPRPARHEALDPLMEHFPYGSKEEEDAAYQRRAHQYRSPLYGQEPDGPKPPGWTADPTPPSGPGLPNPP